MACMETGSQVRFFLTMKSSYPLFRNSVDRFHFLELCFHWIFYVNRFVFTLNDWTFALPFFFSIRNDSFYFVSMTFYESDVFALLRLGIGLHTDMNDDCTNYSFLQLHPG